MQGQDVRAGVGGGGGGAPPSRGLDPEGCRIGEGAHLSAEVQALYGPYLVKRNDSISTHIKNDQQQEKL